jgi:sigma-B regulation protein RsbU (phosphoserine phosphatase)
MRSDGSEFPIELSISQWGLGGKNYFSASIRDITERRQAERALREREERISSIVEIAPDAVISIDHQHEIIMFNSAAEEIFGYHADEVLGQPLTMLMPEGSRSIHSDEVEGFRTESVSARSMDARREIFGLRKNGETFPAEAGISKVELDGQVIFTAFLRDITERKRLEAEIADQLAFVSTLIDTVPNPIFAVGPDLRYSHFNRAYELAYGIEAKDQLGKTVMDIETLSLEQRRAYREQGLKLLEEGGTVQDEIESPFSDGELHTILQWVQTFEKSDGAVGGYVGITADITEIKRLERELENANERMSTELNFARDIQISMLPLIFPAFPDRREVSINAALESAREVGGDFYDFYFLDDDHLAFIVGDVSGKGAPGALMMAVSKTLIKSRAADDSEPASILTHVNNELSEDNISSMFVTVFLAILNVRTGEMVYTNAGHNPPYIRRRNGSVRKLDAFHGPVIGAMPGMPYGQDKDQLVEGDIVLVYSDGVTEAFNEQEELYSEERLEELLRGESLNSDANIVTGIQESLREFVGHAEQSDDITLLAVHFLLGAEALETRELRLTIKNRYDEIGLVDEHFTSFAEENNIPDAARQAMSIVADELLNNIISYAYQGETERDIEVSFELSDDRLVLTIKDSGIPFNPFASESPDITTSIDERMIGGLGIHMVRNLMDDYSYQRQISKNVVTLVKRLDNEAEE